MKIKFGQIDKVKAIFGLSLALSTVALTGCEEEVVPDETKKSYTIDSNQDKIEIKPQEVDIQGEDFKLMVEYYLNGDSMQKWRITDDKEIYMKVYTKGLPSDTKVWIDNIHSDTTLVASKPAMNGITQDSMDDHIHNSLMYGFPISDTVTYHSSNVIEGQNDTFISGSSYGFNGYSSGDIVERRHSEEEYLGVGAYANKISSSFDLLIQKEGQEEPYVTTATSNVIVMAYNIITKKDKHGNLKYYQYDKNGESTEIEKPKVKVKE